jgi:C4-dicarboxylate transporter, DctM subunit
MWFAPAPLMRALGSQLWDTSTSFILVAIPLFILIGEILLRSGIAAKVYEALDSWLSWLPGGLMHANIGTATLFSATSGSSVATSATVGTIALPQGVRFGYDERFFAGSIAAGGTLGILIPPSINLIIYGFLSRTSIPQLFVAGIVPGLLLAASFMAIILVMCLVKPKWGGQRRSATMATRARNLRHLLPVLVLFGFIIGSIYAGWATPTEAAAVGTVASLGLAWFHNGPVVGDDHAGAGRHDAHHRDDHAHPHRGEFPELRPGVGRLATSCSFIAAQELGATETLLVLVACSTSSSDSSSKRCR